MSEKIKPGKYVEMIYDLYEKDGDNEVLVYEGNAEDPEKIVYGVTPLMVPLEKAIEGLGSGDRFEVEVPAESAFGEVDPEMVITVDKSAFSEDGKLDEERIYPGAFLPMLTADGMTVTGLVKDITDKGVVMDFNHPSAGKDMLFKGEVLTVREATPEEIKEAQPGCNCGSCGCGEGCQGESCQGGCE